MSQTLQVIKRRKPSFLDSSLRLNGITELINLVSINEMYFSELRTNSKIKFRKSFLKYLNYSVEKGFIRKYQIPARDVPDRYHGRRSTSRYMFYKITEKGKIFLELLN